MEVVHQRRGSERNSERGSAGDLVLQDFLVRIGILGSVGRMRAPDARGLCRGVSVICRTERGLEFGEVLNACRPANISAQSMGTVVRVATPEDHLLWARIKQNGDAAFEACQKLLAEHGSLATLMDVELMFDGRSIYFYFVGTLSEQLERLTSKLAATYEAKIQLRRFSEAMAVGCGPDCGTAEGSCEQGGCSTCSLAGNCGTNL